MEVKRVTWVRTCQRDWWQMIPGVSRRSWIVYLAHRTMYYLISVHKYRGVLYLITYFLNAFMHAIFLSKTCMCILTIFYFFLSVCKPRVLKILLCLHESKSWIWCSSQVSKQLLSSVIRSLWSPVFPRRPPKVKVAQWLVIGTIFKAQHQNLHDGITLTKTAVKIWDLSCFLSDPSIPRCADSYTTHCFANMAVWVIHCVGA